MSEEKLIRIAVIGSRETPREIMGEMYRALLTVIPLLISRGYRVAIDSGGCWKGPDLLQFSMAHNAYYGSRLDFNCYLPDEKKLASYQRQHADTRVKFIVPSDTPERREFVRQLHPAPDRLQEFSWLLHGRNCNIISGEHLERNVDYVYYNAVLRPDGLPKGGTYMGVAYAKLIGVPTILHSTENVRKWIAELNEL